jgi:hypothetical protein
MKMDYELAKNEELSYDFCLREYSSSTHTLGKFRSINLFNQSLSDLDAQYADAISQLITAIKATIGINKTVWRVKNIDNVLEWEFYFYNYGKKDKELTITNVLKFLENFFIVDIEVDENLDYFVFSIDISKNVLSKKELDCINLYTEDPSTQSGKSYLVNKSNITLENNYFFYEGNDMSSAIDRLKTSSTILDFNQIKLDDVIWPELDCKIMWIANKQKSDSLYYAGINVHQFLFFLEKLNYPDMIVSFVKNNIHLLDHLKYDVGIDFNMKNGKLNVVKSSYFGTF